MKLNALLLGLALLLPSSFIVSCEKNTILDETPVNTPKALKMMKGSYKGKLTVSDVTTKKELLSFEDHIQTSDDALYMELPVDGIAAQIKDGALAKRIRKSFRLYARVKYVFNKENQGTLHFSLYPERVQKLDNLILGNAFSVEFMQNYGGEASIVEGQGHIQTRIAISKLWIDGELYQNFEPILYYFEGNKVKP